MAPLMRASVPVVGSLVPGAPASGARQFIRQFLDGHQIDGTESPAGHQSAPKYLPARLLLQLWRRPGLFNLACNTNGRA